MLANDKRPCNGITLVQDKSALKYVVFMMVLSFLSLFFFFGRIFSTWEHERKAEPPSGEGGSRVGGGGSGSLVKDSTTEQMLAATGALIPVSSFSFSKLHHTVATHPR